MPNGHRPPGPGGGDWPSRPGPGPGPQFDEHIYMIHQLRRQLDEYATRFAAEQAATTMVYTQVNQMRAAIGQALTMLGGPAPAEEKVVQVQAILGRVGV